MNMQQQEIIEAFLALNHKIFTLHFIKGEDSFTVFRSNGGHLSPLLRFSPQQYFDLVNHLISSGYTVAHIQDAEKTMGIRFFLRN